MTSFADVELKIIRWAEARKIIPNSTAKAQAVKTLEEAGELLEAATALDVLESLGIEKDHPIYKHWSEKYDDAVGDIEVTLINGCALKGTDVTSCTYGSFFEIKDRTGHMNEHGIFVKDAS